MGPGEDGSAVAQTHTDTEHPQATPSASYVSSEQLLQLPPLIIRELIVLHNSCLQVVCT